MLELSKLEALFKKKLCLLSPSYWCLDHKVEFRFIFQLCVFFLATLVLIMYLRFQSCGACSYFLAVLLSEKHREKLSWLW